MSTFSTGEVISAGTGGGYDAYARVLARHLDRYLPGQPALTTQNMPGAVGLQAANWLMNLAPKDGTLIGSIETALPFEAFFAPSSVRSVSQ